MAAQSLSLTRSRSRSLISIPKSLSSFLNPSSTTTTLITPSSHPSLSFLRRLRAPPCQSLLHHNSLSASIKSFCTQVAISSHNDSIPNYSNRPLKERTLPECCDFEHWLVVMDPPKENATRDDIIDRYIKTLAKVVGSEDEARKKIYTVYTRNNYAFGALISEEVACKIKEMEGVWWVLPDSCLDVETKNYGGEPFINGQAVPYEELVRKNSRENEISRCNDKPGNNGGEPGKHRQLVPYDPKYHEEFVRNNARENERNRRNNRPGDNGGGPEKHGQFVPYDPKYHEELVRKTARENERNRRNDRPGDYGGEPFINGQADPYDPKYHEEWVRNNARENERNRRNDRSGYYGGEPFVNGKADPYDPKYQEEWERNNAREHERNRHNDRSGNYDKSRNNDWRRENMNQTSPPNEGMQNFAPNKGGMPPNNMGRMLPNNIGGMPPNNMGRVPPNNMGGMPPNNMGNMGNAPPNQGWYGNAHGNAQNFQSGPNYGNACYHGATPDAQYQGNYAPNTGGMPPNNMGRMPPNNMGGMSPNNMGRMPPNNMGNMGNVPQNQGWDGNAPVNAENFQAGPNYRNTSYNGATPHSQYQDNYAPNTSGMPPNNMGRMPPNNMGWVPPNMGGMSPNNMGGMPPNNMGNMGNVPQNQGWAGNAPVNAQNFQAGSNYGNNPYHGATPDAQYHNNYAPNTSGMPLNDMGKMPPNNIGNMGNAPPNQGWSGNAPGNAQNFQLGPNCGTTPYHGATADAHFQNNYAPNTGGMPSNNMGRVPPNNMENMGNAPPNQEWSGNAPGSAQNFQLGPNYETTPYHGATANAQYQNNYAPNTGGMPPNNMGRVPPNNMENMGNAPPNQGWSGNAPGNAQNFQLGPNCGNTPYHGSTPDAQYQNNYAPNTGGMPPNNMGRVPPNNMENMGNAPPNQGWSGNAPGNAQNFQLGPNCGNTPYHGSTPDDQYQNNYAPTTGEMPSNNIGKMLPNNMGGMSPNNMGGMPANNMGNMGNAPPNQGWSGNAPGNAQNFQPGPNYGNTPYHGATPDAQYQNNYAPNVGGGNMPGWNYQI